MKKEADGIEENWKTKRRFMEATFDRLGERVRLIPELEERNFPDEALLLCCCHIEALGNAFWSKEDKQGKFGRNFVRVLEEYGGQVSLALIHPDRLIQALSNSQENRKLAELIKHHLSKPTNSLYSEYEFLELAKEFLTPEQLENLRNLLWRGTIANIVYDRLRGSQVHAAWGPQVATFDRTTNNGKQGIFVSVHTLYRALLSIIQKAQEISLDSGTWCGHAEKGRRVALRKQSNPGP